jgi:ABC-type oligopeptide transport system ATPase subunit
VLCLLWNPEQAGATFGYGREGGCGKAMLGKTILGIYQPTAGALRFQDQLIRGLSKAIVRQVRRTPW